MPHQPLFEIPHHRKFLSSSVDHHKQIRTGKRSNKSEGSCFCCRNLNDMAGGIPKACLRRLGGFSDYKIIPLEAEEVIIGRAKEVTFNIQDLQISRRHAIFKYIKDEWTVESVVHSKIMFSKVGLDRGIPSPEATADQQLHANKQKPHLSFCEPVVSIQDPWSQFGLNPSYETLVIIPIFNKNIDLMLTGMNGIVINHSILPKNIQLPISNMDVIEFGVGSKFMYSFRLQSAEACEPSAKKMRLPLLNCNKGPSVKDSEAFQSWVKSKKVLEKTLVEENEDLEHKLIQHNSREDHLVQEKEKIAREARSLTLELESQFKNAQKILEDKVARGEIERNEIQQEKEALEKQMQSSLQEVKDEFSRKTRELESELLQAKAEKEALLEQKEIVVQQLQRENEILEERLNEERRVSAAAFSELSQLKECRQRLEHKLEEERRKFEEEKAQLLLQGSNAESRLKQLEQERNERDLQLESTKAELQLKEQQVADIQNRAAIGLEIFNAMQSIHQNSENSDENIVMVIQEGADRPSFSAESELERMRQELQMTLAEKEEMQKQLEAASVNARLDAVCKLENVVENELQCGICSELYVMASSLNCSHVFCAFCIGQWKKTRNECPICRTPISTEVRSIVIDNAIDGIVATFSEEAQRRRKELVQQRRLIAEKALTEAKGKASQPNPSTSGVGSGTNRNVPADANRRGRSRGRPPNNTRQTVQVYQRPSGAAIVPQPLPPVHQHLAIRQPLQVAGVRSQPAVPRAQGFALNRPLPVQGPNQFGSTNSRPTHITLQGVNQLRNQPVYVIRTAPPNPIPYNIRNVQNRN